LTIIISPVGRGRWRRVTLSIPQPADLFPAVRDGIVHVGMRWLIADRWWRVVEVQP
jgi:hypothetical protein